MENNSNPILDENHIITERRQKLENLKNNGFSYPNTFKPNHLACNLQNNYSHMTKEELLSDLINVSVAGRIMLKRLMGKASFVTIQDGLSRIQLYISKDKLGENNYEDFKHLDIGDIIGVTGNLFKTKTDELTIDVSTLELITKSLRPLPEKFHGLTDQEIRYRQRYLDLIMNQESRELFITRSKIVSSIRNTMIAHNYLEVETPMLHPIPGGANAKPFSTHHNALDMELFLRIAPELYLKKLIVGGLTRVFEINRSFRNEGLSVRHNPEFTMVEYYESYANYQRMMEITEEMIRNAAKDALGTLSIKYQEHEIDLAKPFERLNMVDAIIKYNPSYQKSDLENLSYLQQKVKELTKEESKPESIGVLQLLMFEETTETKLIQPTFIIDYPVDVSPLARLSNTNPLITERFELFIVGRELANGYSELNDSEDQANRFKKQSSQKDSGNEEAMYYDADYIRALEYGMPHTGGGGIGIDRLVMLLTNASSIREVLLFPQMRPE
jgi:lysyl-tRNA synthetase, class II